MLVCNEITVKYIAKVHVCQSHVKTFWSQLLTNLCAK